MRREPAPDPAHLSRQQLLAEIERLRQRLGEVRQQDARLEAALARIREELLSVQEAQGLLPRLLACGAGELRELGLPVGLSLRLPAPQSTFFLDREAGLEGAVQRRLTDYPWVREAWESGRSVCVSHRRLQEAGLPPDLQSLLEMPLPERGSLGLSSTEADFFTDALVESLQPLAGLFAEGLQRSEELQALTQSKDRLTLALEAANVGSWEWDLRSGEMIWSDNFEPLLGLPPESFQGRREEFLEYVHPEDRDQVLHSIARTLEEGSDYDIEFRLKQSDPGNRWLRARGRVFFDQEGVAMRMTGVLMDITQRREAEEALRSARDELEERVQARTAELRAANESLERALREKEVLLREIHHRVKNNLQIISSLFALQSSHIKDEEVLRIFADSGNRVRSMALIHEKLYQAPDLSRIDFGEYVRTLAQGLFASYGISSARVAFEILSDEVDLSTDATIHCGLIINELVSNALKYAFPEGRIGRVRIELRQREGRIHLQVEDDGIGFPDGLDFRHTTSLGLRLVVALVEHLGGDIDLKGGEGTRVRISFPYRKRPRS